MKIQETAQNLPKLAPNIRKSSKEAESFRIETALDMLEGWVLIPSLISHLYLESILHDCW